MTTGASLAFLEPASSIRFFRYEQCMRRFESWDVYPCCIGVESIDSLQYLFYYVLVSWQPAAAEYRGWYDVRCLILRVDVLFCTLSFDLLYAFIRRQYIPNIYTTSYQSVAF